MNRVDKTILQENQQIVRQCRFRLLVQEKVGIGKLFQLFPGKRLEFFTC